MHGIGGGLRQDWPGYASQNTAGLVSVLPIWVAARRCDSKKYIRGAEHGCGHLYQNGILAELANHVQHDGGESGTGQRPHDSHGDDLSRKTDERQCGSQQIRQKVHGAAGALHPYGKQNRDEIRDDHFSHFETFPGTLDKHLLDAPAEYQTFCSTKMVHGELILSNEPE